MTDFVIERLTPSQTHLVYPIVREAFPGITLQARQRFVRRATARRSDVREGVMCARRPSRSSPSGLFCYRHGHDIQHGSLLTADHILAFDLLDSVPVIRALIRPIEALGRQLGCNAIRSVIHAETASLLSDLFGDGPVVAATSLTKPLTAVAHSATACRSWVLRPSF